MKVTAVIINHNGAEFLEKCVNSVTAQVLKTFEIIIIDSFSSDDSAEILAKYGEFNIKKLSKNTKNIVNYSFHKLKLTNVYKNSINFDFLSKLYNNKFILFINLQLN